MTDVVIKRRELFTRREIQELNRLHSAFFENTSWKTFARDFRAKDWVIVIKSCGRAVGFSTMAVSELNWKGHDLVCLFSGDTVVDPHYWQSNALIPAFGEFILYCHKRYQGRQIVWHLISKGYRTYRLLPAFFHEFFPRHDKPTPEPEQELLDWLSTSRFDGNYQKDRGIVWFQETADYLCNELAAVSEQRMTNPHVRFFLERNPGYRRGDELACLTDLARSNIKASAMRMISRSRAVWIGETSE